MDSSLFARAALVQALLVAALFGVLIALPLGDDFFEDYGWITGPVAWVACAAVAARILALPPALALFAAAAGGIAGAVVGLAVDHTAGAHRGDRRVRRVLRRLRRRRRDGGRRDLVAPAGIEPPFPASKTWCPDHWTTGPRAKRV